MLACGRIQRPTRDALRQVDDFTIASPNKEHADSFLDILDGNSKQKLKLQGILSFLMR